MWPVFKDMEPACYYAFFVFFNAAPVLLWLKMA